MDYTSYLEIESAFHSMPLTKYKIAPELEQEWLKTAVADYELEIGCDLQYDPLTYSFAIKLSNQTVRILSLMMYVSYLQRELSRVMALNGIYGKDIQITGTDATKRATRQELEYENGRVQALLHKMKVHSFE